MARKQGGPGKAGKGSDGRGSKRVVERGVKVSAVASTRGPPSTTVHVEVEPAAMAEQAGDVGEVRRVEAELPEERDGAVRWSRQELHRLARERRVADGKETAVERFGGTHLGPSDAQRLGVGVDVQTDRGTLRAPARSEAYAVREADKPRQRERVQRPAGKKKR
ncbi:MAG: hypothetical protein QM767_29830 [Anaeromyxobacter sp.]